MGETLICLIDIQMLDNFSGRSSEKYNVSLGDCLRDRRDHLGL